MITDTTFLIDVMRNDERAVAKLNDFIKNAEPQLVTAVTIFELFSGLARSTKPVAEKNKVMNRLKGLLVLHLDYDAAQKAGEIDGDLIKSGEMIQPLDSMIAGIALIKKEKVLTRNVKDFSKVKNLEIETY